MQHRRRYLPTGVNFSFQRKSLAPASQADSHSDPGTVVEDIDPHAVLPVVVPTNDSVTQSTLIVSMLMVNFLGKEALSSGDPPAPSQEIESSVKTTEGSL